jgi:RNA-binding protein NOB1
MTVHLKKNFQYRTRGTIYSIPNPKPGSAKGGPSQGLVLREDQVEWVRATKNLEGKQAKEEKRIMKGLMSKGGVEQGGVMGSWMDPDWVPEIISASAGGKGRTAKNAGPGWDRDMPAIGYGRRNPNERRRKR